MLYEICYSSFIVRVLINLTMVYNAEGYAATANNSEKAISAALWRLWGTSNLCQVLHNTTLRSLANYDSMGWEAIKGRTTTL